MCSSLLTLLHTHFNCWTTTAKQAQRDRRTPGVICEAKKGSTYPNPRATTEVRKRQVQLQEHEMDVHHQQMENEGRAVDARIDEANVQASKLRQEAEHWRQQRKIALLRERKQSLDEGVSKADIDALLPLTTNF